jgi:F-type H+-transporting ATPase subunit b
MIEINFPLLLAQILSFLVAVLILWKLFWGPLTQMIERRRREISRDIEDAKEGREAVDRIRKDYEQQLSQIRDEARRILDAAMADGQHAKDEILKSAHEEARAFLANAKAEIVTERELASRQIKRETVDLAVLIAEKILRQSVNKATQDRMLGEFIDELKND